MTASAIALLIHRCFPTAPPRVADVGLVDTLRQLSGIDIGVVLYARRLVWRTAGAVYPFVVVLTTVVTGNHFVLDAVAGMLVLGLGFAAASVLFERDAARLVLATRGGAVR